MTVEKVYVPGTQYKYCCRELVKGGSKEPQKSRQSYGSSSRHRMYNPCTSTKHEVLRAVFCISPQKRRERQARPFYLLKILGVLKGRSNIGTKRSTSRARVQYHGTRVLFVVSSVPSKSRREQYSWVPNFLAGRIK